MQEEMPTHMAFSCLRCGKRWDRLSVKGKDQRIVQKHLYALCTPQGEATANAMRRMW